MERIELLRRRIDLYRRYLREGAAAREASLYLQQIRNDEAELAALARDDERDGPTLLLPRPSVPPKAG